MLYSLNYMKLKFFLYKTCGSKILLYVIFCYRGNSAINLYASHIQYLYFILFIQKAGFEVDILTKEKIKKIEIAQKSRVLADKTKDLNSITRSFMAKGENESCQFFL